MIKIKTKYDNETDQLTWNYESKKSNTMEHLAVIQNLFDVIIKNDPILTDYKKIYEEVKKVKKSLEKMEEE